MELCTLHTLLAPISSDFPSSLHPKQLYLEESCIWPLQPRNIWMSQHAEQFSLDELSKTEKGQNYTFRNLSSDKITQSLAGRCPQLLLCAQCWSEISAQPMHLAATTKHVSKVKLDFSLPCLSLHGILARSQAVPSNIFKSSQVIKKPAHLFGSSLGRKFPPHLSWRTERQSHVGVPLNCHVVRAPEGIGQINSNH